MLSEGNTGITLKKNIFLLNNKNCSQCENFLLRVEFHATKSSHLNLGAGNPNTLKKERKKKVKLHFSKRATEVSTALRCLSCFLCFFPFTTVARGSSLWSLTCIPDRQKKSTQPVAVGEASSLPSSPANSVLKTPARSPPSSTRLQHRSKDIRLRHYGSCQAVVCQSCLQMVIQALSSGA